MEKHFKIIIPIIIIVLISLGAYFLYPFLVPSNNVYYEFDDNNTSIKTTLLESSNISYEDNLTLQNEGSLYVTKKLKYKTDSKKELKYKITAQRQHTPTFVKQSAPVRHHSRSQKEKSITDDKVSKKRIAFHLC